MSAHTRQHDVFARYVAECLRILHLNQDRCFTETHGERQRCLVRADLVIDSMEFAARRYEQAAGSSVVECLPVHTRLASADWPGIFKAVHNPNTVVGRKERCLLQNNLVAALECLVALRERANEANEFVTVGCESPEVIESAIKAVLAMDMANP